MGAERHQLLAQFLVESCCISALAMLIAMAGVEFLITAFNNALDRAITIEYLSYLPWLVLTTIAVGVAAGLYPAYLITRVSPLAALAEGSKGAQKSWARNIMLGFQFTISILMLAMVAVVYLQNQKMQAASELYPKEQVLTLERLGPEPIMAKLTTLKTALLNIDGVAGVSYGTFYPFLQNNSTSRYGRVSGDEDIAFSINQLKVDEDFLPLYEIPLLHGRNFEAHRSEDILDYDRLSANVVINELAAEKLGFASAGAALDQVIYDFPRTRAPRAYRIIGVIEDQNMQGFHNQTKALILMNEPQDFNRASILIRHDDVAAVRAEIEAEWDRIIPEYPIQLDYLSELFERIFTIFSSLNLALGSFAFLAMLLSMVGLFGLAAFMAQHKTREIGIRKVLGANTLELLLQMVWQFSRPVLVALVIALPLSYFGAVTYLQFFQDRLQPVVPVILLAGLLGLSMCFAIVAIHAYKVANRSPVYALRHE